MFYKFFSLSISVGIFIPNVVLAEQVIIQQGSANATAHGDLTLDSSYNGENPRNGLSRNHVNSRVYQSATQNQHPNPDGYINGQKQVSTQQGYSNAAAEGNNNTVVSNIDQNSEQNQHGSYRDPNNQSGVQNAADNAQAIGNDNRIINNTRQYNRQNQWKY